MLIMLFIRFLLTVLRIYNDGDDVHSIITSAKEVLLYPAFVCWSCILQAGKYTFLSVNICCILLCRTAEKHSLNAFLRAALIK